MKSETRLALVRTRPRKINRNSSANKSPATIPGTSVPSGSVSLTPRRRTQPSRRNVLEVERQAAWMSGGMSGSASFTATGWKPQLTQSTSTSATAAASSGRATGLTSCFMLRRCRTWCDARWPSRREAVRADAGEFDHRRLGSEAGGACRRRERGGHLGRGRLADRPAALADQKDHQRADGVIVHAGHEGVAALDAVHEAILAQELERTVGGDRRRPRPLGREQVDDLVGAERLVAPQQCGEHLAADRGQALAAFGAERFRDRHGVRGAAVMIMVGGGKNGGRACRGALPR